jgi:hypothetical protein
MAFNLHSEASLGQWIIQAVTKGQYQNYSIFVDYYELPLANVTINLPKYKTYSDPVVNISVESYYTFGKPVKGMLTFNISVAKDCKTRSTVINPFQKTLEINGQSKFSTDLRDTKQLDLSCPEMILNFTAFVKDNVTNHIYTTSEFLQVSKQAFLVKNVNKPKPFKPNS